MYVVMLENKFKVHLILELRSLSDYFWRLEYFKNEKKNYDNFMSGNFPGGQTMLV